MFLEEMKIIRLKDQQGLFLLQAVKILLEGFGVLTAKLVESRRRAPPVSRHFLGIVPNAVDVVRPHKIWTCPEPRHC